MIVWLFAGLSLYCFSVATGLIAAGLPEGHENRGPLAQFQVALWKAGNVSTFAWLGYAISRDALGRLGAANELPAYIGRGLIMAAVIYGGSLGL